MAQRELEVVVWWWWESLLQESLHHLYLERGPKQLLCLVPTIQMARPPWSPQLNCWYTLNICKTCIEYLNYIQNTVYMTCSARKHFFVCFFVYLELYYVCTTLLQQEWPMQVFSILQEVYSAHLGVQTGPDEARVDSGGICRTVWNSHLKTSCNNCSST